MVQILRKSFLFTTTIMCLTVGVCWFLSSSWFLHRIFHDPRLLYNAHLVKVLLYFCTLVLSLSYAIQYFKLRTQDNVDSAGGIVTEQLQSIFDTLDIALWSQDIRTRALLYVSPGSEEIWGLPLEILMNDASAWFNAVHPEDLDIVDRKMKELKQGKSFVHEFRIIHPNGETRWVHDRVSPIFDKHGELEKLNGMTTDVTERKRFEEELHITQQTLKETIQLQQGLIFKFIKKNDRYVYTMYDGDVLRRNGITPKDIIGKELEAFLPSSTVDHNLSFYERAWQGEDVSYEFITPSGLTFLSKLRPVLQAGNIIEIIGFTIEISDRKKMEEALRKSEEKYRLITDNMSDLIRLTNIYGVVTYASPSHATILGYPPKMYEGHVAINLLHPDDIQRVKDTFIQAVHTREVCQTEFRSQHRDGHWIVLETQYQPVVEENGTIEYVVVVGRDITERKHTEGLLRKSDKLSAVGQLAAGMAHEIRNPLTAIKGFIQLLCSTSTNQKQTDYFDIILSELKRIEQITNEMLILAKPQAITFHNCDIQKTLRDVVNLLESQAVMHDVQINMTFDADIPQIRCEENQLKQVFVNIIKNALEAMPTGGELDIRMYVDELRVMVKFSDQGRGIQEDRLRTIGEPFYTTKEKGTGLGLLISHKIIQTHQGTLHISSQIEKGTTVTVGLPALVS